MTRIAAVVHENAEGKAKELLDAVKKQIGFAPNLMKTLAQSPAALDAYLGFSAALGKTLNAKLREQLSLVTAEKNGCSYCASAHTAIGKMAGLTDEETIEARSGKAKDAKSESALTFAQAVIDKRGFVGEDDLAAIRVAGYRDGEIVEIVAHVALNIFTNYFNNVAGTEIDFPKVEVPLTAAAGKY